MISTIRVIPGGTGFIDDHRSGDVVGKAEEPHLSTYMRISPRVTPRDEFLKLVSEFKDAVKQAMSERLADIRMPDGYSVLEQTAFALYKEVTNSDRMLYHIECMDGVLDAGCDVLKKEWSKRHEEKVG